MAETPPSSVPEMVEIGGFVNHSPRFSSLVPNPPAASREDKAIALLDAAEEKAATPYGGVIKLPVHGCLARELVVAAPGHWRGYERGAPWASHNQYLVFTRDSHGWTYSELQHPELKASPRAMAIRLLIREVVR